MLPIIIYHGGCCDGFCSAWVIRKRMKELSLDVEYFEGHHGQDPPNVTNRDVVIVDFSYKRLELERMANECTTMLILDHHKTAKENLEEFKRDNCTVEFDMGRSGAGMAWDHYFPNKPRPWLVDYVEDRDLWHHNLEETQRVNAYISTLEYDFDVWDRTMKEFGHVDGALLALGSAVISKTKHYVHEVAKNAIRVDFEGYKIPLVNAPQVDISELLNFLAKDEPFSMGWWQRGDGIFSYGLRSIGDFDVSVIAKRYGGGGHKNAAGFQLPAPLVLIHRK